MVDFRRHRSGKIADKKQNPIEIYDSLDRISEKGPLRPAQEAVLNHWFNGHVQAKDVIIKLHTGSGKTLVGLLILQSHLNAERGPCLYVCPNRFLAEQTCERAREFGFRYCTADDGLPAAFLDGNTILITYVQKLFNGLSIFGIGPKSEKVASIVIDDAHACIDSIRQSVSIAVPSDKPPYGELLELFSSALSEQGMGEFADIQNRAASALLPVPYWHWKDKASDVTRIIAKHTTQNFIKFAWPVIKDQLAECLCLFSGTKLEISPYSPPLHAFGTYFRASQRIFMSATISDDSYLIKALGIGPDAVRAPIRYEKERWSGEKMVLFPSLIHESLDRETVAGLLAAKSRGRRKGYAVLAPSFEQAKLWSNNGAEVATTDTISEYVSKLKAGHCEDVVTFVNRYDGIDLPDDSCRVLIIDSKPFSNDLIDRYYENCRGNSDLVEKRAAQTVEQGMGRHIRGEKDYGVVVLTGTSLVKSIRATKQRKFFSAQSRHQIAIGDKIVEFSKEDLESGKEPKSVFLALIRQCVDRDEQWKDFYVEEMDKVPPEVADEKALEVFVTEKQAEDLNRDGRPKAAMELLQKLLDRITPDDEDKGWYLQEMARYQYNDSKAESNRLQIAAHKKNNMLLRPREGMEFQQLEPIGEGRVEAIIEWIQSFSNYADLNLKLTDILDALQFGVAADRFEQAIHDLGKALGFASERPDKQWKAGPDVLWCLRKGEFLIIECKSEVSPERREIHKDETGQMNNACAWFADNYPGATSTPILVIPAQSLGAGAGFVRSTKLIRSGRLSFLRKNVRHFFAEFQGVEFGDLSVARASLALRNHALRTDDMIKDYTTDPRTRH